VAGIMPMRTVTGRDLPGLIEHFTGRQIEAKARTGRTFLIVMSSCANARTCKEIADRVIDCSERGHYDIPSGHSRPEL